MRQMILLCTLFFFYQTCFCQPHHRVVDLSAKNSYLQFNNLQSLEIDATVTVGIWAYHEDWKHISKAAVMSSLEFGGFELGVLNHELYAAVMREGYRYTFFSTSSMLPGWHHLAFSYDGQSLKLFVDGKMKSEANYDEKMPIVYPENPLSLLIGAELGNDGQPTKGSFFSGQIDQLLLYDQIINDAMLLEWYRHGRVADESPILCVSFDQNEDYCNSSKNPFASSGAVEYVSVWVFPWEYQVFWGAIGWVLALFFPLTLWKRTVDERLSWWPWIFSAAVFLLAVVKLVLTFDWWSVLDWRYHMFLGYLAVVVWVRQVLVLPSKHKKLVKGSLIILIVAGVVSLVINTSLLIYIWGGSILVLSGLLVLQLVESVELLKKWLLLAALVVLDLGWLAGLFWTPSQDYMTPFASVPALLLINWVLLKFDKPVEEKIFFSQREQEVASLIAEGLSDREIAERLFVSYHTIRTHVKNIYKKLEVSSRLDAIKAIKALPESDTR